MFFSFIGVLILCVFLGSVAIIIFSTEIRETIYYSNSINSKKKKKLCNFIIVIATIIMISSIILGFTYISFGYIYLNNMIL